jgi:crotonobetainyl-CoA:carnitine CoA-transferase CaiB-like acyl-CoA transferase
MLLADMGADVVKVESPAGDDLRRWPPIVELSGGRSFSLNFASLNRNKRSVCLDLKTNDGLERARVLAAATDIIIENFRPGVMPRLGLGFEDVKTINPDIIFCSISGYGQVGPRAKDGAYDVVIQAESGVMDITGTEDGPPVKCGVPVADFIAGHYAAFATIAAYVGRQHRDGPVYIDLSMLESMLAVAALQTSEYWGTGELPRRLGSAHPRNAPYQAFEALDGPFVIAAGNDGLWRSVCDVIAAPELAADPRFMDQSSRVANAHALEELLNGYFAAKPASFWVDALRKVRVPSGLINNYADVLQSEQLEARGFIHMLPLPDGRYTPTTAMPLIMDGRNIFELRPPPMLGEHTSTVLAEWEAMAKRNGVVGSAS